MFLTVTHSFVQAAYTELNRRVQLSEVTSTGIVLFDQDGDGAVKLLIAGDYSFNDGGDRTCTDSVLFRINVLGSDLYSFIYRAYHGLLLAYSKQ